MAKVFTKDIKALFNAAVQQFIAETGATLVKRPLFFIEFVEHVNEKVSSTMKSDTVYKQYDIRLKSWKEELIGCAWDYLNPLSKYVNGKPYYEAFEIPKDTSSKILSKNSSKLISHDELEELQTNPEKPEFPFEHPAFPATPQYPVEIPGFKNVWVKDESFNPRTGTHKDRMAWEVYLFYQREIVKRLKRKRLFMRPLSIISSGNAALAIQSLFQSRGLPNLKVILDENLKPQLRQAIKNSGCQPYYMDLDSRELSAKDILDITENQDGIQLNFTDGIEDLKLDYYDWLSYEILNLNPNYVFVPFGSGELYKNILEINTKENKAQKVSKRYFGDKATLGHCHFIGGTTFQKDSSLKMLYAKYNNAKAQNMEKFIAGQVCGRQSQVAEVQETYVKKASELAKNLGIRHEPSGIAGLALLLQMQGEIDNSKKIVLVNTGRLRIEQFK